MSSSKEGLFSYDTLVHAVAGATGSVVGMTVFYPLDTVRSRLQLEESSKLKGNSWEIAKNIAFNEGVESLYRGIIPVLQSLCASNFVYFYSFHGLRKYFENSSQSALRDLCLGAVAGCINVILTTPLWVVNTRMKMQKSQYSSLLSGLLEICQKEGLKSLWSGTLPSLILVSNPALQFMTYEALKRRVVTNGNLPAPTAFLLGAIAKAFATIVTYPLQLGQARLRAGLGMTLFIREAKRNPKILFKGLEAKIMQTVLTAALMLATYEKIARFVLTLMRRSKYIN